MNDPTTDHEQAPPPDDPRVRRRARFRRSAQSVAIDLFTERGFDTVTMAEIADALDVSERTLFRYFPSKESLLDPAHEELVARLTAELGRRPSDETAFVSVRESLRRIADDMYDDRDSFVRRMALIEASPTIQAHLLRRQTELEDAIADVVATRRGLSHDHDDLRPRLVAAAAVAALRVAVERWVAEPTDDDLLTVVEKALNQLDAGLGQL